MANIFDYIQWRGDLTFTQDPPNAVDALIFSALSYINYGCRVEAEPAVPVLLKDAAEDFLALEDHESRVRVKNDLELLRFAADSIRFGRSQLCMYRNEFVPEQETQFAAMTFLLDDGSMFLAFRGTDYSLIGWKEDFNMTFQQTVPAQRLAQQYVREVAMEYSLPMRIGGHSKGSCIVTVKAGEKTYVICGDECYQPECLTHRIPTGATCCPEKSRAFVEPYSGAEFVPLLCHALQLGFVDRKHGDLRAGKYGVEGDEYQL